MQRCVTLALYLKSRHIDSVFITQVLDGDFDFIALENGFSVLKVTAPENPLSTYTELTKKNINTLIIDNYSLSADYESYFVDLGIKVIVIDDLDNRPHNCQALIDQNYKSDYTMAYKNHTPAVCKLFLGPEFALIRPEFFTQRKALPAQQTFFVFFGSADPSGETLRFIRETAQIELSPFQFKIIVSKGNAYIDDINASRRSRKTCERTA